MLEYLEIQKKTHILGMYRIPSSSDFPSLLLRYWVKHNIILKIYYYGGFQHTPL